MAEKATNCENTTITKDPQKSQNARLENGLTVKQMNAAELLAFGKKVQEVADTAGISRHQLWVWQKNPYFVSAISKYRAELWGNSKQRLRGLVDKSVDVLEQAIESGDLKAAIELLKIVGLNGKIGNPGLPQSIDEVLTVEATKMVDASLAKIPFDDPMEELDVRLRVRPSLIYKQVKKLNNKLAFPEEEAYEATE
ncbi:MAG: hypothetical protein H6Q66_1985 [Firmicutes bacterium]|nr:hypothetical protein [Bacillota bacterium]